MIGHRVVPADPDGAVVLFAASNWDDVTLSDLPLAQALAELVPVLYVDPPLPPLAPRHNPRLKAALRPPWLKQVAPNLWRVTPIVGPWPLKPAMTPVTQALTRAQTRRGLAAVGPVRAIVSTSQLLDVFDLVPGARHLYWTQDDTASGAAHWGHDPQRLLEAEQQVARSADLVVSASPFAAQSWSKNGFPAAALPNGCDLTRFEQPVQGPIPSDLPRPVVGFVGHLNDRIDFSLLEAVADTGISLRLVGPVDRALLGTRWEALLARPNVRAAGSQPFEDMPRWLASMDAGLVPYRMDEFNRASFPLKLLEYLGAGLPVVSTDLPAVHWLDCRDISIATGPADFAAAAQRIASVPTTPELARQRRDFARGHTWTERARSLLAMISAGAGAAEG